MRYLLYFLFSCHLAIVSIYNFGKLIYDRPILGTVKYVEPFFTQNWEMFAPPPKHNTNLYYRYVIFNNNVKDTTQLFEILGPLYHDQLIKESSFSRLSYFLFNCCQDVSDSQLNGMIELSREKKMNDNSVNNLLNDRIYRLYSHKSIVKHSCKVFSSLFPDAQSDSVFVSYSITHDRINKNDTTEIDWKITSKFVKML